MYFLSFTLRLCGGGRGADAPVCFVLYELYVKNVGFVLNAFWNSQSAKPPPAEAPEGALLPMSKQEPARPP